MSTSWSHEHSYHHIRTSLGSVTSLPVHVHNLPPPGYSPNINLFFIFDPECSFVLSAKFPLYILASQFIKFYGIHIIGYTMAVLLVLISGQMYYMGSLGSLLPIYDVFGQYPSYLTLVIVPSILTHFGWIFGPLSSFMPATDKILYWNASFAFTIILRTFLFLIASGLVMCIFLALEMILVVISLAWMWTRKRAVLEASEIPLEKTIKMKAKINKVLLIFCCLLAAVSVGFSSSLASTLVFLFYILKLSSMHIRSKIEEERRGPNSTTRRWYFHFSLVVLCLTSSFLTFPGLIMWLKNVQFSLRMTNDLYVLPCTSIIISLLFLWQLPTPSINRYMYEFSAFALYIIGVVISMYSILSVFRLLYFIAISFVTISVQQTIAYYKGLDSLKYY